MMQNLFTVLMTTLAVSLAGCQEHSNTAPAASTEQAIPEPSVVQQEASNDVVAEELPFIVDDAELEEITANDLDQELTIDPAEGTLQ